MKRILPLFLAMCLLLSGCMCLDGTVEVHEDGSVTASVFLGMTPEAINQANASDADLGFEPTVQVVRNGVTYLGEYQDMKFDSYEGLNSGEGLHITKHDDSYTLVWAMTESVKESIAEEYGAVDEETMKLLDTMYYSLSFKFPHSLVQSGGPTSGVHIDGNTVRFDLMKMEVGTYTFYSGQPEQFLDVAADAWYNTAIQAMQYGELVEGYGDGNFGPNDKISLASICTILARVDGAECGPFEEGGYWAEKAIAHCIENGYIRDYGEVCSEEYDRNATREEVVAAISMAYAGLNARGDYDSDYDVQTITTYDDEYAMTLLRQFYDDTGYSVYITGDTSTPVSEVEQEHFLGASNGVAVVLDYTDHDNVRNLSYDYYQSIGATSKAYVSQLFAQNADPFYSLECADYSFDNILPGAYKQIPDLSDIGEAYRDAINTAYAVGICSGVDAAGTFLPKNSISRAEVCQLFYNINWTVPGVS